jgi:hypothetical protein
MKINLRHGMVKGETRETCQSLFKDRAKQRQLIKEQALQALAR